MKKLIILLVAVTGSLASFSQTDSKPKAKHHKHHGAMQQYSCPMHPEVVSNKPGKCSKCGMALQAGSKKEQMKMEVMKTYTCPMHPGEVSDKPGKCSKCGMAMAEVKTKSKTKKS